MGRIRTRYSTKSKYYLNRHAFLAAYHWTLQYHDWKEEYEILTTKGAGTIGLTDEPHGTGIGRPTERDGIRAVELADRIRIVDDAIIEAAPEPMRPYLLYAVTHEYIGYESLTSIPYSRRVYYNARRKFYYLIGSRMK